MTTTDFSAFGLSEPLLAGLARAGFTTPTPIQARAIPPQMEGRDILGLAQTGTGKTAAFGLPMLHAILAMKARPAPNTTRALILAPTRELAVQIAETLTALSGGARLAILLVLGGTSRAAQIRGLNRGVDILIATPGRLTDLADEGHLRLADTAIFVLDEADRMLDLGFIKPVQQIARRLHPKRRTALFSATMPAEVEGLAAALLKDPVRVEVSPPGQTVQKIAQSVELMSHGDKRARLAQIVTDPAAGLTLVFTRTKRGADRVVENLEKDGIEAAAIHGNKAQNARQRALKDFAAGRIRVLVATDIAARGIDVKDITHVVQYDIPDEPESYVHRIGRTGRNGAEGIAVALCAPDEMDKLRAVERLTKQRLAPANAPREPAPARQQRPQPQKPAPSRPSRAPQAERAPEEAPRPRRRRRAPGRSAA